jgi:hypothetical protein
LQLILANTWSNTWPYIQHTIEEKLIKTIQKKYKNLDMKLAKLEQQQQQQPQNLTPQSFYPRIINNTNITFTNNKVSLLEFVFASKQQTAVSV